MWRLALALISHPPDGGWSDLFNPARVKLMTDAGLTVLVAFLAMIPVLLILSRLLPATPMFRSLILDPAGAPGLQEMPAPVPTAAPAHAALNPGDSGTAQTDLRPGGVAGQSKQLLQLLMAPFHNALLHGPPGCAERLPAPKQRKVFFYQCVLEVGTSIASHDRRQSP